MNPGGFAMGPSGGGEIFFGGLTPSDRIAHGPMQKRRRENTTPLETILKIMGLRHLPPKGQYDSLEKLILGSMALWKANFS